MPWGIYKHGTGYKVCQKANKGNCRSKKPISKEKAKKQIAAININETFLEFINSIKFVKEGDSIFVKEGDRIIGHCESREEYGLINTAKRMFPNLNISGPVFRITGIAIDTNYRDKGLGKLLYLYALRQHPNSWFYNSQAWDKAGILLRHLNDVGYIELYEATKASEGLGVHIKRITEKGISYIDKEIQKYLN